ncbi:hypothetical protein jhhlp_006225 [Lomentospora prolificans]|uniref:Tryptophan synthase beta chain-like PALP domain-containing protein n=1 Tax=Lomentospora prolificans TaxID=41688 RepID=A0A2N3N5B0_9PEZI|nr:hypothetical protein jhhlp_006225 [Lomentospora prolificans]
MSSAAKCLPLTRSSVQAAHELIKPHVHRTPVIHSRTLDEFASRQQTPAELKGTPWEGTAERAAKPTVRLWIKCENLQRIGAFKARGAFHAVGRLVANEDWVAAGGRENGVATHSSGNHAQALALAARENGVPAHVVMPSISNPKKVEATKGYGAFVYESGSTAPERQELLDKVVADTGATFVPPYNHPDIILGQGTAALELQEQAAELIAEHAAKNPGSKPREGLDAIVTPCGGGGLLSGTALSCEGTGISVFAGEPSHQGADDLFRAIRAGLKAPIADVKTLTIADGLRTPVGEIPWSVIRGDRKLVRDAFTVTERDISKTLKFVLERLKVVVEPSAVVGLAVVLFNEEFRQLVEREGGKDGWDIGVIFTGGNVSLDDLPALLKIGEDEV